MNTLPLVIEQIIIDYKKDLEKIEKLNISIQNYKSKCAYKYKYVDLIVDYIYFRCNNLKIYNKNKRRFIIIKEYKSGYYIDIHLLNKSQSFIL